MRPPSTPAAERVEPCREARKGATDCHRPPCNGWAHDTGLLNSASPERVRMAVAATDRS